MNPVALKPGTDYDVIAACEALSRSRVKVNALSTSIVVVVGIFMLLVGSLLGWGAAQRAPVYCSRPVYEPMLGHTERITCIESGRQIFVLH